MLLINQLLNYCRSSSFETKPKRQVYYCCKYITVSIGIVSFFTFMLASTNLFIFISKYIAGCEILPESKCGHVVLSKRTLFQIVVTRLWVEISEYIWLGLWFKSTIHCFKIYLNHYSPEFYEPLFISFGMQHISELFEQFTHYISWLDSMYYLVSTLVEHDIQRGNICKNATLFVSEYTNYPISLILCLFLYAVSVCLIIWIISFIGSLVYLFGLHLPDFLELHEHHIRNIELIASGFSIKTHYFKFPKINYFSYCDLCEYDVLKSVYISVHTSCEHFFHLECIRPRINILDKCPLCDNPFLNGSIIQQEAYVNNFFNILKSILWYINMYRNILRFYRYMCILICLIIDHLKNKFNPKTITYTVLEHNGHKLNNQYNTTECYICYDTLDDQINVLTKCKHLFHQSCFKQWIKIEQSCPICRSQS